MLLHVALPAAVLLLAVVVVVDLAAVAGPQTGALLVPAETVVLGYFLVELGVDFVLYHDKRAFLRDRWIDIVLLVPFVLVVRFGAWVGGLVLLGRALRSVAFVGTIGLEAYAIEELTVAGSRLQRALKLLRKGRTVLFPDAHTEQTGDSQ
jgi:hypothetical protein